MGWLIALAVVLLIAIVPVGVFLRYDSRGVLLRAVAGPIRLTLLPPKKKKNKPPKKQKPQEKKSAPPPKAPEEGQKPSGGSPTDFLPLVKIALELLNTFRRKLRVDVLEVKLIMAGGDPCNLAIQYGRTWAAVGNLLPLLDRFVVIKKRDVEVECDFTASQAQVSARLELTITIGRIVAIAVVYGFRALTAFLKIRKKRKGGAENESETSEYAGRNHSENP